MKTWNKLVVFFKIKFGGELEFPAKEEFELWLNDQPEDTTCSVCYPTNCVFARFIKKFYKNNYSCVGVWWSNTGNAELKNPGWVYKFIRVMNCELTEDGFLSFKRIKELWRENKGIAVAANLD